jgi:hypothetical protein
MLFQFNNNTSQEFGTAKLIRKNITISEFQYQQLDGRSYRINDPVQGYVNVKASQSIKTTEELDFVNGDLIKLDTYKKPLRVANMSKKVKDKQLMFLDNSLSVEYILDLE